MKLVSKPRLWLSLDRKHKSAPLLFPAQCEAPPPPHPRGPTHSETIGPSTGSDPPPAQSKSTVQLFGSFLQFWKLLKCN